MNRLLLPVLAALIPASALAVEGVAYQGVARSVDGVNPGAGRVRLALVADTPECLEAAQRIVRFIENPSA